MQQSHLKTMPARLYVVINLYKCRSDFDLTNLSGQYSGAKLRPKRSSVQAHRLMHMGKLVITRAKLAGDFAVPTQHVIELLDSATAQLFSNGDCIYGGLVLHGCTVCMQGSTACNTLCRFQSYIRLEHGNVIVLSATLQWLLIAFWL